MKKMIAGGRGVRELQVVNGHRLSGRQREIGELAVSGLTNKAIARWLATSARTVEGATCIGPTS